MSDAKYSIGTWDTNAQSYLPQTDPAFNLSIFALRKALRALRDIGYGAWRMGNKTDGYDSDWSVLVERTDGRSESDILEGWKR